ncbi:MAG: DUF1273 family protein [Clostridia bacterium]|nr:DUF1273 family protein [Clostridia bacterium]
MFCCFTGHRPESLKIAFDDSNPRFNALKCVISDVIDQAISDGYTDFYCGMARGIDMLCATLVLDKAKDNPSLHLHAVLPCPNQRDGWIEKDIKKYEEILSQCTTKTVMSPFYSRECMLARNRFMVDNSGRTIAVWNGFYRGGTAYTVRYAKKQMKEIFLIRPSDLSVTEI